MPPGSSSSRSSPASCVGTPLLGPYLAGVFGDGERARRPGVLERIERPIYRLCGVDPEREQRWSDLRLLAARLQRRVGAACSTPSSASRGRCPLNPDRRRRRCPQALSFNTAVSFVTNTNWQNYAGEITMSYLTQMAGPGRAELRVGRRRPLRWPSP